MDTDNEADVVAASRAGAGAIGDMEAPDGSSDAPRSRDAITRRIRNPLPESRQLPVPTETPTPTPVLSTSPQRSSTPAPKTPTPKPVAPESVTADAGRHEPLTTDSPTVSVMPAALAGQPPEPARAAALGSGPGRRMELSGNIHLFPVVPEAPAGTKTVAMPARQKHKGLIVIAVVMVCGVVGNIALWRKINDRPKPTQPVALSLPVGGQEPSTLPREAPAVPAPLAPTIAPLPEPCHVEITVQEAGAQLVLDGTPAEGNQIKLDVPKDDKPHLVEASAPGFVPFKRSVSFSTNVFLTISLQKARPSAAGAAKRDVTAGVKPDGKHADEQGVSSRSNAVKRPASKIDEDDPYAP